MPQRTRDKGVKPRSARTDRRTFVDKLAHFECSAILGNSISDPFSVKSGAVQGSIMSPILFLVVIDWMERQVTSDKRRGIQWTILSHLEDIDFADDLAEI